MDTELTASIAVNVILFVAVIVFAIKAYVARVDLVLTQDDYAELDAAYREIEPDAEVGRRAREQRDANLATMKRVNAEKAAAKRAGTPA